MAHSIITSKGQITIPKTVRDSMNLKTGDVMDFTIRDGSVILVPVTKSVAEVFGMLSKSNGTHYSVEQMNEKLKKSIHKRNS